MTSRPHILPAGEWWQSRRFIAFAILLSMLPLLLPAFPPLVDMPGHIGRYHVAIDIGHSPVLQQHWTYHWALIGNLGVDLLVIPLAPLVGVVFATKLVVLAIPPLFVGGLIWLSLECDGRVSPAAPLAFPLVYGFPFQFGFVNFVLAAALALNALALWIRLGRQGRIGLRTGLFVPLSCLLWIAHSFGWGMFGLFAFAAECVRLRRGGAGWLRMLIVAGSVCLALAPPIAAMIAGNNGTGLGIVYDWPAKVLWFVALLREKWELYDAGCASALTAMLVVALRRAQTFRFEPQLAAIALIGFVSFLALPRLLLGGAYVDMRMLGIALALGLVAIRMRPAAEARARTIALLASGFFVLRMATSTIALFGFAQSEHRALQVIPAIPRGAAVLVIVNEPCGMTWASHRLEHVDGIAIARRDIFDNAQWTIAGQQLIAPRHPDAAPYRADPSQLAYPVTCYSKPTVLPRAIRDFDRGTFGYVWTMDFASRARLAPDVVRVWSNDTSTLYRVVPEKTVAGRLSKPPPAH